ncbi:MAG: hypothetical protein FJ294_08705 [Planctomycetes bacterium]|nr:hypothetical protein [Planctomycetota bacterium]
MAAKETITVYDQQGQPREIPRAEFTEKVLPKLLEASWNQPEQLYQQVVFGLENGLHQSVLAAAARLDELDAGRERGRVLLSAAQFQCGQHDVAETTLRASIERNGESAVCAVNLARMRQARGDEDGAQTLLSRALELDANQEMALSWSCQLMQQAGGEAAVLEFLGDLSAAPANWRAASWLAQQRLRGRQTSAAVELLRRSITGVAQDSNALMAISAELGKAGALTELVELVGAVYDERRQRPETGCNLLRALIELKRTEEAKALFGRLAALNLPPLAQALGAFAAQLGLPAPTLAPASAGGASARPQQQQQQVEIRLFMVQGPLWMQGLGAPWLGPQKDAQSPLITFVGFADEAFAKAQDPKAQPRVDEDLARMARALPLYLSESVHLRTGARSDMVVPLLPGGAFVVTGQMWPTEALVKGRPVESRPSFVVQGVLAREAQGFKVELVIAEGASGKEVHRIRRGGVAKLEEQALGLEDELLGWLAQQGVARSAPGALASFARPSASGQGAHLVGLGNLLMLCVPAIGLGSRESLSDEKELLDGCLESARCNPACGGSKVVAAAGILFALRFGSNQADAAKAELAWMIEQEPDPQGVLSLLSPGLWLRLGDKAKSDAARAELANISLPGYREWIATLDAKPEAK